ncbi:hypothetical protein [Deinococcus sp.]|uniref:hypothetical protein n=1 Tax=Deinococcus sp. TaxID=47478 RepID=UPI0025FB5032|nr:hypothetical protein [Deinococcus sp.]
MTDAAARARAGAGAVAEVTVERATETADVVDADAVGVSASAFAGAGEPETRAEGVTDVARRGKGVLAEDAACLGELARQAGFVQDFTPCIEYASIIKAIR